MIKSILSVTWFWIMFAAVLTIIAASMLFAVATTVVIAIVVAIIALPAVAYHGYTGRWPDWFKVQVIRRKIDD